MHPETARTGAPSQHDRDDAPASAEALVDAIGMAWSSYTLYEDPLPVEAFRRALETLGHAPEYPFRIGVGVDGFTHQGEPVASRREGSIRIARQLFALGAASLELRSPPAGDDLLALFGLCDLQHPPDDPIGDLHDRGVTTIRLLDREMLHAGGEGDGEDHGVDAVPGESGPAAFVTGLLGDGEADPATVARLFVEEYERAHLLVDTGDMWSAEELVRSFVDGFWYLPEAHRAAIFSRMLERGHREENTAFLDQFGGIELAEMNRMFGAGGHPLLAEYLRVATSEGGRHRDDLHSLVSGATEGPLTRRIVEQVASVLRRPGSGGGGEIDAAIGRLAESLPGPEETRAATVNVLRSLFLLADGPDGMASAAHIWASRVATALEAGDFQGADDRINVVAGLRLDDTTRRRLLEELAEAMTSGAVGAVARLLTGPAAEGPGAAVRKAAPLFATGPLVRELGAEHGIGRRKMLLGALETVARLRPAGLLPHLDDPRWFVVRNVLIALGGSRRPDLAPPVASASHHPDARVRVEVLRALFRLQGAAAAATLLGAAADPDLTVAREAGRLLGALGDPGAEPVLLRRARSRRPEEAASALAALGGLGTPAARKALARAARRPFAWRGRARRIRAAARHQLEPERD